MNLLDTASLVVTPNGYKASKLYSIIPSDGSGDMTFARTGDTATRVNSSGLIETVLANKPRLDYFNSTCPKLLLEPQRTNLNLDSQDVSSGNWLSSNVAISVNQTNSPSGVQNADLITGNAGTSVKYVSPVISAGGPYTFSCFVKSGTQQFIQLMDVNDVQHYANFDIINKTVGNNGTKTTSKIEDYGNGWLRLSSYFSGSGFYPRVYFVNSLTAAWNATSTSTNNFYLWGVQSETASYATSYIPTTTASVTRNADSCITGSVTSLVGQTEGTIFVEISRKSIFENFFLILSSIAGTTSNSYQNSIYFLQQSNGALLIEGFVSNVKVFGFSAGILSLTSHKIAIGYKLNDFVLYIDGVQIATDTSGTVPAMNYFTLAGGADGGANSSNIKSSALWKTRLQNAELATLTSI